MLGIALGLAMDAFAVSIVAGMSISPLTGRHVFRLAWHFGLFQFLMPIAGWAAGRTLENWVAAFDHWIAAGLLGFIGGRMLVEALRGGEQGTFNQTDPTRGMMLITLSLATSLDALAVGISVGLLGVSIWTPSLVIGVVAGALTVIGITLGARIGQRFGRWASACGGLVLMGIGVKILLSHLGH